MKFAPVPLNGAGAEAFFEELVYERSIGLANQNNLSVFVFDLKKTGSTALGGVEAERDALGGSSAGEEFLVDKDCRDGWKGV